MAYSSNILPEEEFSIVTEGRLVELIIDSPNAQKLKITYVSLGNEILQNTIIEVKKGINHIDLTKYSFVSKHAYFEVTIRSPFKLNSYRLIR